MHSSEMKTDGRLVSGTQIRRVGLLSAYSGGNLGNTAIIWAMIVNLRNRIPGIEILGITLNPDDTRRRFDVDAFPLVGLSRPYFTLVSSGGSTSAGQQSFRFQRLKQWGRRVPILRSCLRLFRMCHAELSHFRAARQKIGNLDRLIVTGGGPLGESWGGMWGEPWTLFKWSLLCRLQNVPLLFVSVGKSTLQSWLSRAFVRSALKTAVYRSYRDKESWAGVQGLIKAAADPVYPDLAFSHPVSSQSVSKNYKINHRQLVVGVSPIAYCDPRSWPIPNQRRYEAYIAKLAEMVKWLIGQGHRILLFSTDSPDAAAVDDIQSLISCTSFNPDIIRTSACSAEQSSESFLEDIAAADITIASRLHGIILSHVSGTPALALSFDPKVDAHMNAIGRNDYCLSIDDFDVYRLIERFTALSADRVEEGVRIRSSASQFRRLLEHQYDRILGAASLTGIREPEKDNLDVFLQYSTSNSKNG
jgi:polysaccharide pyruvyl transferase WcaK-like protein